MPPPAQKPAQEPSPSGRGLGEGLSARPPRPSPGGRGSRSMLDVFVRWQEASILLVALLLIAWFENANHDFLLTSASLENLSQFVAPVAIIACGEIMLMIGGEIDLSAGMVFALAPFVMYFAADAGVPVILALLARPARGGRRRPGQRRGHPAARRALLRHHARHAVPGQRDHADHLARHAGLAAGQPRLRADHGRLGLQRDHLGAGRHRSSCTWCFATRAGACTPSLPAPTRSARAKPASR